jgi:hypothetical protein
VIPAISSVINYGVAKGDDVASLKPPQSLHLNVPVGLHFGLPEQATRPRDNSTLGAFGASIHTGTNDPGANVGMADEFLKQAEEAKQMARHCLKVENEAWWLRLAENWLKLAREAEKETTHR